MNDRHSKWYRLDNQAKIFPEVYGKREPHVFRIQIALKEKIESDILQIAVNNLLERYPMFKVKLKRGLFWVYLDTNDKPFYVQKMTYKVVGLMDFPKQNDYLFRVLYRKNTIAVETFHTLTDGTGLSEFVKSLTYEYLKLKGYDVTPDNIIRTTKEKALTHESEDSSKKYYSNANNKRAKEGKAFRIAGTETTENELKVISLILSTKEVKALGKEKNATITEYIVAAMTEAIYKTQVQYKTQVKGNQHPIKIGLPVNLRTRFPSDTMRNFVNIISVEVPTPHDDVTFDDILEITKKEIKEKTTKEELTRIMSEYVSYEKNILVRIIPSILKKYVLKIGYSMLGSKLHTMSLSNVGLVKFPASMEPYIHDMAFMVGASRNNHINVGVIAFGDKFKVSFNSNIMETSVHKEFVRHFTSLGLDAEIESNYMEENL
ncbi:Alcohol acetyltransferase [Candidatus Izimaplasma bacterium HR1]|jgi:NRPS condensation-like uncharacterized protein|uniref:acyltransferase n=1 Tax=Candidatus Izimoplasma sp. HR1 TaxID=1541959 RepID=UPI0004F6D644|nr:Alcohol acetyltransferase [Candidatus Izimaplasma bacterium HR1]